MAFHEKGIYDGQFIGHYFNFIRLGNFDVSMSYNQDRLDMLLSPHWKTLLKAYYLRQESNEEILPTT